MSAEGNGQCQLTATEDDVIVKSIIFETLIGPALDGSGEVPEPWEDWRQDFIEYADEAKTAATQAVNAATSAAQSSDDAANSATAAETAQVNAEDAADRAEEAAGSIGDLAEDAEAWAVGQRGGVDVPDTDPAYENNAKYYAEQAGLRESGAETSANIASTQAGDAITAANTATAKANEAARSAGAAQASAGSAASSASDAADSARAASDIADEIKELTAEAETLPAGSSATADYDAETGVLSIGVPVGNNGDPGVSPTVTVTDITGGHRITITDADGPHSFDVMNGPDGVGIPTGGTTGQVLSKASGTDYDTEWTTPRGGDVTDVQVNGVSVVSGGVANVPAAYDGSYGVVRPTTTYGVININGYIGLRAATDAQIKAATAVYSTVLPNNQYKATFYGLAKAAGDTTQSQSSNAVGTYTDDAKVAIQKMLGIYQAPWELIREYTFTNTTEADHIITADSNGQAFELTDLVLLFETPKQTTASGKGGSGRTVYYNGDTALFAQYGSVWTQAANADPHSLSVEIINHGGLYTITARSNTANGSSGTLVQSYDEGFTGPLQSVFMSNTFIVTKINITAVTGTGHYKLYGKRKWN